VLPVRSGARLVAITFVQSQIVDEKQRELLYTLNEVAALEGLNMQWDNRVRLEHVRHSLHRMWPPEAATHPTADGMNANSLLAAPRPPLPAGTSLRVDSCRQVLATDRRIRNALHLLGLALRQSGDLPAAADCLSGSVDLAPRRGDFRVNFGNLLRSDGRLRDAEEQYSIALELEPNSRIARLALARVLNEGGAHEAARAKRRSWWPLTRGTPRPGPRSAGPACARRPRCSGSFVPRALELKPGYGVARHNLGALLGELKRAEESLAELDLAAAAGISGAQLQFNRGRALMELGRLDEAEAALSAAATATPRDVRSQGAVGAVAFHARRPGIRARARGRSLPVQEPALRSRSATCCGAEASSRPRKTSCALATRRAGLGAAACRRARRASQEQGRLDEAEQQPAAPRRTTG